MIGLCRRVRGRLEPLSASALGFEDVMPLAGMFHMFLALNAARNSDGAAQRTFGWSRPADTGRPQAAARCGPRLVVRHCPICGHVTHQRLVEIGRDYLTYWCSECVIPHDVERTGDDKVGCLMKLGELIQPQSVLTGVRVGSKREALRLLARQAASRTGQPERAILDALVDRERLGSTGVGSGIAVPHARLPGLDSLCAVFLKLDRAIEFDAVDERPVSRRKRRGLIICGPSAGSAGCCAMTMSVRRCAAPPTWPNCTHF